MKRISTIVAILLFAASSLLSANLGAAPPTSVQSILTYQGSVFVDDEPFAGTGGFKLVFVDVAGNSLWSNDNTSVDGSEPTGSVSTDVNEGVFDIRLGDTSISGMGTIDPAIFNTADTLYLKVWFNDGSAGFSELTPSIQITSSIYSMNSEFLRGYEPLDFFLQTDQITSSQIAPGAVDNTAIAGGAVSTTEIADNSVTGAKIVAFTSNDTAFTIGSGAATTNIIFADQGAANNPGLRFDSGTTKWQYSNDGTVWNDIGTGGGGGVSPGLANQMAYYAAAGATVSGLATGVNGTLVTSGAGAPSISSTLPAAVQGNITAVGIVGAGTWQAGAILDAYVAPALTISGGTVNNTPVGGATAAAGTFTDLTAENDAVVQGGDVTIGLGTTAYEGRVILHDADAGDSFTTTLLSAADVGASWSLALPAADGTAGQALTTNAGGQLGWSSVGSGDVTGPGSSVDNRVALFSGVTGKVIKESAGVLIDGSNNMSGIAALTITSMGGNWTNAGRTVADLGTITTVDINGGTIDGTTIGGVTAGAGDFTNLEAQTTFLLGTANQGDVLYDNNTSIVRLTPGTNGQFLMTQGAGANPVWAAAGGGDVVGPAGATNDALARFDTATGKLIQNSGVLLSDTANISGVNDIALDTISGDANAITVGDGADTVTINPTAGTAFSDKNITDVADIALDTISGDANAITVGDGADTVTINPTAGTVFSDKNITDVADIALDTISSDAGTTVSVTLGTDAGDDFIAGNNNALVVEGDNDRVGVGTNAPAYALDVDGVIRTGYPGLDGQLRIYSEQGATDYEVSLSPNAAMTQNTAYTMPPDDGTGGQFMTTDGAGALTWTTAAGTGDVVGPAGATDNAITRFDTATGKLIQDSGVLLSDTANISGVNDIALDTISGDANAITVGDGADTVTINPTAGTVFSDKNITDVADIALDTISSDAGTTVSVTLGTDAGDDFIAGNNNALVVEGDNDRVGVGTNAPAYALDVDGVIRTGYPGLDGQLRIYSEQGATDYEVSLSPNAAMTQNTAYTMPPDDGTGGQFMTTDGAGALTWTTAAGTGDVVGPAGATDNAITRFDTATGKLIQDSGVLLSDTANISGVNDIALDTISGDANAITVGDGADTVTVNPTAGTVFSDKNITDVADIALDTISSDAGTTVSVTLGTDAGDDFIAGNNNALVVEGDNDRVGVGTNAPAYALDVDGVIRTGYPGLDGQLRIYSEQGATDYEVSLSPNAAMTQNTAYTMPPDDGTGGQFMTTDGAGALTWTTAAGTGDVVGPAGATDNAITRFDTATGKLIQDSGVLLSDTANISGVNDIALDTISGDANAITVGDGADTVTVNPTAGTAFSDKNITDVADIALDSISADATSIDVKADLDFDVGVSIHDANGNELLTFGQSASAVNELAIVNAATGVAPSVVAAGGDANIDLTLIPKGTGEINISKVDIDAGTIDGTTIGGTTPAAGSFLALQTGVGGTDGQLTIFSEQGGTDYTVIFNPNAAMTQNTTYSLPPDDGTGGQFMTTDGAGALTWTTAAGTGDVVGPAGATDNAITRFDTATGKLIQDSGVLLSDTANISGVNDIALDTISGDANAITVGDGADTVTVNPTAGTAFSDKNITDVADIALDTISGDANAITVGDGADTVTINPTAGTVFSDKNITDVADIALDTISSDAGTTVTVTLGTDAGDDFIAGNNNALVVEGDNDRVGVGTNAPAYALDVDGVIRTGYPGLDGQLRIYSEQGATDWEVSLSPNAAMTQDTAYTMPPDDGTVGQLLRTDGAGALTWSTVAGTGDVVGPAGATDNAITRFDTATGKLIQDSGVLLSDTANISGVNDIALDTISSDAATTVTVTLGTDAGDDFIAGNNNALVVEGDNDRVGIGTATPATNAHVYENNTDTTPALQVEQDGTGDSAQHFLLTGGQSVSAGIDNNDNDNFKVSNTTSLTGTTYSDVNTMMRIHTETGSEGIVDINHQSRARVYQNVAQTMTTDVWEKIEFDSENFDEKGEFDTTTNYRFTALEEGYYQVNARTQFDIGANPQSGDFVAIAIYKNGAVYSFGNQLALATSTNIDIDANNGPNVSDIVPLVAGDYIEIWGFQNSGTDEPLITGTALTYVSIHKSS